MPRCLFCGMSNLKDLDAVWDHQNTLLSNGNSICPHIGRLDPFVFEIPTRWADHKYAPTNENGYPICYKNNGTFALLFDTNEKKVTDKKGKHIKKTLVKDYLSMHKDYRIIQRY